MNRAIRGAALLTTLALAAAPSWAATARDRYAAATARQEALRAAERAGRPPTLQQYRAAVAAFEDVVRRHPTSGYADNALWEGALLAGEAHDRFGAGPDLATASRLLTWLAEEYPTSPLARKARGELDRLAAPAPARTPPPAATAGTAGPRARPAGVEPTVLRNIRRTVMGDVVRVTIELDDEVEHRSERIENPPRVFFDLSATRLGPAVPEGTLSYSSEAVRHIRVGRHPSNVTRVVLDLEGIAGYSVFTLYSPFRIVIDCQRIPALASPPTQPIVEDAVVLPPPEPEEAAPSPVLEGRPLELPKGGTQAAAGPARTAQDDPPPEPRAAAPAAEKPDPSIESGRLVTPAVPPVPPPNGYSLSRQLGLGATRIVIDPGHGGQDPGAKGLGIYEAQIVLDVALRLEKLLAAAGSEVVLTRRSDTYVPLEDRPAIANRAHGDLFLSIHANASRNRTARGVESYVLNFATSPDAEAVAARENASTGRTMSSLTDIVRAITLNNKLDESKSFAAMVQARMVQQLGSSNRAAKTHGVRQAPFLVLIGASMPSVLVEISFITHSQEGRLLKTPGHRQKIAEALFEAIRDYQRSLKGTVRATPQ